jgi:REP element-mobilizing transposase RayT
MASSEIMRRIKDRLSSKLFECFPEMKKLLVRAFLGEGMFLGHVGGVNRRND